MRVLVVQTRRLGDVLMVTPLLRALHRLGPRVEVDVLVEARSAAALAGNPHTGRLVDASSHRLATILRVRRRRYDAVIDAMGKNSSALLTLASGARKRIGFDRSGIRWCYTHRVEDPPALQYSALQKLSLAAPLGIDDADGTIDLPGTERDAIEAATWWSGLADTGTRPPIAFAPVSRRADKRWPPERFAWVCDGLVERTGRRLLPLFGPGEAPQVEAVIAAARVREAFVYPVVPLPFAALPAALSRCAGHVGNDNAIRHVAVGLGLPTLAVFGRPRPVNWTPPGAAQHLAGGGQCDIAAVTIEAMAPLVDAFARWLAAPPPPSPVLLRLRGTRPPR